MYDLGDGAGVLVQPRQHRHVARPRLRGHPRVRHAQHAWKIFVTTDENICTVPLPTGAARDVPDVGSDAGCVEALGAETVS